MYDHLKSRLAFREHALILGNLHSNSRSNSISALMHTELNWSCSVDSQATLQQHIKKNLYIVAPTATNSNAIRDVNLMSTVLEVSHYWKGEILHFNGMISPLRFFNPCHKKPLIVMLGE